MTQHRIPNWDIPDAFEPSKLNDLEEKALLYGVNKALRLLEIGEGRMNIIAGYYAEAIDLENRRRFGFDGKPNFEEEPLCLLCNGIGKVVDAPIK